jgi:aryl-alcohol dehydrogenase-like predicted oxidoreductase
MLLATLTTRGEFFAHRPLLPGITPTPRIILGTAGFGGVWGKVDEQQSIATLHDAWSRGFLFCDTAPSYSRAEQVVGAALKSWSGPPPVVATKFGYDDDKTRDYSPAGLRRQFARSVERFNGTSPTLVAIHDAPAELSDAEIETAVDYLRSLIASGDVIHVGLGGGGPATQLRWLKSGVIRYILTFNRLNACVADALNDGIPNAHEHNAKAFAASPLFMGMLGRRYDEFVANPPVHIGAEVVRRAVAVRHLADQAGASLANVSLRFLLSMREVDAVVVGASSPSEWRETHDAFDAGPLPADLFNAILAIAAAPGPGSRPRSGG